MSSLKDSVALLESDLVAEPPRISVYHDLPFAIMRYDPADEWGLRWEIKLLTTRLESFGKEVHVITMSVLSLFCGEGILRHCCLIVRDRLQTVSAPCQRESTTDFHNQLVHS